MASNSKDDVVIVKVENGRIIKRTNSSTSDTGSKSQPRKKRKLVASLPSTDKSTDDVLLIDCDARQTSSSGNRCHTERDNEVRVEENDSQPSASINAGTERDGKESVTDDISLVEQQMLDHALALSLEQEELEKFSRNHISNKNEREYPISNNTSLSSRVSPVYSNSLTTSYSQPVTSHAETAPSLAVATAEAFTDKEFELPMYWQPMPENCPKNYELFMVLPGTEEYNKVTQQFLHQPLLSVYSVKRIQNIEFLKRYTLEKKLILSIRGRDFNLNEHRLFHTSTANPDDICEQGLDNRLSRSGGSFGAGIYFSDDVLKCHCYWRHSFQPALMFQCRVILGDVKEYPRGIRDVSLRREPEKVGRNPGEQRTYDSVKGNITGRNEFVVYNTYRVMPEYMIEYTFTNTSQQTANRQPSYRHPVPPIPAAIPTDQNDPRYLNILSMMQKKGRTQK